MQIVKSVGVLSVARIMGLVYACMGLLFAPFLLLMGMLGSLAGEERSPFAGIFGVAFALLAPFIYGVFGFIAGAVSALLYNLFSKLVGGFELELEARPEITTAPYPLIPPATPAIASPAISSVE